MKYGLQTSKIGKKDYIFGASNSLKRKPLVSNGQWGAFVPPDELQRLGVETMACTSFAILNAVEILERQEYGDTTDWSERYLAYISGTTRNGNNANKVAETLRKKGDVKETYWSNSLTLNTWSKFYEAPPRPFKSLALQFILKYSFGHEWVTNTQVEMMSALQYSPLTVAGYAWSPKRNGLFYSPKGKIANHYFVVYGYSRNHYWDVFDSYDNTHKRLQWGFSFSQVKSYTLHNNVKNKSAWTTAMMWLKKAVIEMMQPKAPVNVVTATKSTNLVKFCTAIRDFEGKPGDLNYKNNNPGNARCSPVGYLPKYGFVKCVNNFAVFSTYALGWEYLNNLVHFKAVSHPTWTILDFFNNYAPTSDNNPTKRYASFVAKRMGVSVNTKLNKLFT